MEELLEINLSDAKFSDDTNIIPRVTVTQGKKYVPWGDRGKNDYPDKLIDLINDSALHNAICVNKAMQVAGNGFIFDENGDKARETAEFLEIMNDEEEDANEILAKVTFDFAVFNGFSILVTWSKDWSRIESIEHVEFNKIRCERPDSYGKIKGYWYAYDWKAYRPHRVYIPAFDPKMAEKNKVAYKKAMEDFLNQNEGVDEEILLGTERTQILVFKSYRPDSFFYPVPSYSGAITSIESDIQSDIFALYSLKNGLSIDYTISFPKASTKENQRSVARNFYKNYTTAKNAGVPLILFKNANNETTEITKIDSPDADKRYLSINENSLQKILAGHRVTHPSLVGILTPGKLGGTSEIMDAQKLFYATVINPDQLAITKQFNKIMKINGLELLSIDSNNPFETVSEATEENNNEIETGNE